MATQPFIRDNESTTALIKRLKLIPEETRPLDKDEERALIEKYRNDPDTLQKKLILHNIRLVFNLSKKYALSAKSFDELIGQALHGLCYAASKFDIDRGIKFSTYATPWVFKYVTGYDWKTRVDAKDPMNFTTSIDQMMSEVAHSGSDGNGATMENFINDSLEPTYSHSIPSIEEQLSSNEQQGFFDKLKAYLSEDPIFTSEDPEIFTRRFIERQTYTKISNDMDIPTREIKQREKLMLEKFKEYLGKNFNIKSYADVSKIEKTLY